MLKFIVIAIIIIQMVIIFRDHRHELWVDDGSIDWQVYDDTDIEDFFLDDRIWNEHFIPSVDYCKKLQKSYIELLKENGKLNRVIDSSSNDMLLKEADEIRIKYNELQASYGKLKGQYECSEEKLEYAWARMKELEAIIKTQTLLQKESMKLDDNGKFTNDTGSGKAQNVIMIRVMKEAGEDDEKIKSQLQIADSSYKVYESLSRNKVNVQMEDGAPRFYIFDKAKYDLRSRAFV